MRVSQLKVTVPTIPRKWHMVEKTVHVFAMGMNQRAFLEIHSQELIKIYGIYASKTEESSQKQRSVISAGKASSEKSLLFNWPS